MTENWRNQRMAGDKTRAMQGKKKTVEGRWVRREDDMFVKCEHTHTCPMLPTPTGNPRALRVRETGPRRPDHAPIGAGQMRA